VQPTDEVPLGHQGWVPTRVDDPASGTPAEFWPSFAARYYAREPCEADKPATCLAVSAAELFQLLISAVASRGRRPQDPALRLHIGQRQVIADIDEYLPNPDDASLDGYMARMERELDGAPYLLVVEHAQVASRRIWKTAARFLASLYEATGVLPGGVDVEVFVGRYPNTIPGIHRERSGVFVSMVQGSKDMLVWPPDAPGLPLGTARYQQSTGFARRLRCEPGRLVYWPALHWHVGESPAQSTAGLHIAVLAEPPTIQDLLTGTSGDLDAEIAPGISPGWSGFGPHELGLPSTFETTVQSVISAYGDSAVVRDKLIAAWLRRRTGLGFTALPPTRKVALRADQTVTRDGVYPIVLASRDSATSWLAADGRVGYARSGPSLIKLVDSLNSGETISVRAAVDLAADPVERDVLTKVLALLANWRSVEIRGEDQEPAT
jgi:50S ribosomal protein L16 3-hydroxylase